MKDSGAMVSYVASSNHITATWGRLGGAFICKDALTPTSPFRGLVFFTAKGNNKYIHRAYLSNPENRGSNLFHYQLLGQHCVIKLQFYPIIACGLLKADGLCFIRYSLLVYPSAKCIIYLQAACCKIGII